MRKDNLFIILIIVLLLVYFFVFYEARNPTLIKDIKALNFYQEAIKPLEKYDSDISVAIDIPKANHYAVLINCSNQKQYMSAVEAARKIKKQPLVQYQIFYRKKVFLIDANQTEILK